ncbi:GGDEF domain-containing protein [Paenibacillus sp. CF384]|uniref:GGDEF domain-containing protein n=1 Tax=Paenibacillus sp. CF384 TaxID=1884382 RepID=UPI00089C3733|nr:GGDEF domain-containing protein [Paenibacillus sp. CF384]SDX66650.1 diguanylate cyclase (GGDEF) domain-containing protein [Paenibacillus sp. CF384]
MSRNGRLTACVASCGTTLATASLCLLASKTPTPLAYLIGTAAFAAAALPIGYYLGLKYDRLKEASILDSLTGLYNRRFIESNFKKLATKAKRNRKKMTVMLLDVNDFKEVNDRMGHSQGDTALALIARTLTECANYGEIIGRWGGDEFILICPYADDKGIDRIVKLIHEQLYSISLRTGLRLSVSVGHASFPEHGMEIGQLLQAADKRMYAEKYVRKAQLTEPAALQA